MRVLIKILLIIGFILSRLVVQGQVKTDSLYERWNDQSLSDVERLNALSSMSQYMSYSDADSAFVLAKIMYDYASDKNMDRLVIHALSNMGTAKFVGGDLDGAMEYYEAGLEKAEINEDDGQIPEFLTNLGMVHYRKGNYVDAVDYYQDAVAEYGDKRTLEYAQTLSGLGNVYSALGDYESTINCYTRGLKVYEAEGRKEYVAAIKINLGSLYLKQDDRETAKKYYREGMKSAYESGHLQYAANALANLGRVKLDEKQFDSTRYFVERSISAYRQLGAESSIAHSHSFMGSMYLNQMKYDSALLYYDSSVTTYKKTGDKPSEAGVLASIAAVYHAKGDHNRAAKIGEESLELARKVNDIHNISRGAEVLTKIYEKLGDYKTSLEYHKLHVHLNDSLKNEENTSKLYRAEYKYEYDKKAAADSVRSAERAKIKDARIAQQDAEIRAKRNEQYLLFGGLSVIIVFSIFVLQRYQVTRKQKGIIEKQRDEVDKQRKKAEQQREVVEEKNKEILDSINYAKRLQNAILPAPQVVKEYLAESFILYKPKDIVAGDFYWMETIEEDGGWTYIAAADCTGHGVPGAMVSVVCSNALSKSLIEEGIRDTGKLLDRTRELVIQRFMGRSNSEILDSGREEIKDGMDISLLAIRHDCKLARWSGANNPLWIVHNFNDEPELEEIKADKQPIGKYEGEKPFTQHELNLESGDSLYMFSDGYQDQFGGPKGKKYKSGKLKKFFLTIQGDPMQDQKTRLDEEFESWRKDVEQIDDVCVIGIRI